MLPVYIPARNESKKLPLVVRSIRRTCALANVTPEIVVVDDGSVDDTAIVAHNLGCRVIVMLDRGYSALGKPELADVHNSGIQYIRDNCSGYEFIMVSGADTIFERDYLSKVIKYLNDNPEVTITAGVLAGRKPSPLAVTGTGRIYRRSVLENLNYTLERFYSWESYPLYLELASGHQTRSVLDAEFTVLNTPHDRTDFAMYGIGMWESGFTLPYVFGRAFKLFIRGKYKQSLRLLWGRYITANIKRPRKYPKHVRKYIRRYQWRRIVRAITFGRVGGGL